MRGLIHHIEIYVSNLRQSQEFWGWLLEDLGYDSYQKWDKGQSWKLDQSYIVFVQAEDKFLDICYHRRRVGLNHIAFHATSKEHVDTLTEQLKEKQIPILYQDRHPFAGGPNHYAIYFEDPDRIKVEIVAPS
ncbi:hypothetical conserved protein [Oceanobacillus iheyensis HTE831]|uniref:Hypothetical conserved protein n=1 Tax=Oceanobacillus iheyensis (strain DSM 14371 / CIP 107618 / JCM 11309 / KCTC 3954 / HTE831) TaxID=221109 RepID=Q8ESV6_OCEIH|nr:VOC family protein [Oceanobacillus iheyensis]BAC12466.1 hypothetical conserved protein [Oceanobacillus iheyensis HTE831]